MFDGDFSTFPLWHHALRARFELHPAIKLLLKYPPTDLRTLMTQWPHVSETDPTRLAYTRSPEQGALGRQTITSVGKYVARHWPDVSDHERRDVQAMASAEPMYFVHTTPEMIEGVELGPRSCMASSYGSIPFKFDPHHRLMLQWLEDKTMPEPEWGDHPYSAYAPEFDWHMALRREGGRIIGRALCNGKTFVRTYYRPEDATDTDMSGSDHALAAWLETQGYERHSYWHDGTRLRIRNGIAPFIDGCIQRVHHTSGYTYYIDHGGEYLCDNTDGSMGHNDEGEGYECENCGYEVAEEEQVTIGRDGDSTACPHCIDGFTWVEASSTWCRLETMHYYVESDRACTVDNTDAQIDSEYPPLYVVKLENGDLAHIDDCVDIGGDWYRENDDAIVLLENGAYELKDDATCIGDEWYHVDDERIVLLKDDTYALKDDATCIGDEWYHVDDEHIVLLEDDTYALKDDATCIEGKWYHLDDPRIDANEDGVYYFKQLELQI